ncbi:hypothetical protein RHS01_10158 [Rhizoctonia solani]|uniref:Uncharacterized protein n=1 Tax=Rhizoctonia solani TaxID=456999 RepID=A0A8H7LXG1_9AGAM|nr:hypothetical protein RHS01_10158 [Rhizoctonia solani]
MSSQTEYYVHPPRAGENGPEAEAGECALINSIQSNRAPQDICAYGFVNKSTKDTKITSKRTMYPALAQAQELVEAIFQRQKQTQRRLEKLGWTDENLSALQTNKEMKSFWAKWVCWPESPTDKDWTDIEQKFMLLLEEDLAACPERTWKKDRAQILSEEFNKLLTQISPPPPFPSSIHLSDWEIIQDLWKTDLTKLDMLVLFDTHRQNIQAAIVDWKRGIESHFASLVYIKRRSRVPCHTVNPTLLRFESKANSFKDYTDKHKMLLRGNILFYNTKEQFFAANSNHVNLSVYDFYLEAHLVARALMKSMYIPKASYHLMVGLGGNFQCKRCLDAQQVTWVELIRHYIVASEAFKTNLKAFRLANKDIMYRNVHDIHLPIERPMVGFCSINPPQELGGRGSKRCKCLLCTEIPGLKEVAAPEWAIFRHVMDVHGISEPVMHLHYNRQRMQEPVYNFGGYKLPPHNLAFI